MPPQVQQGGAVSVALTSPFLQLCTQSDHHVRITEKCVGTFGLVFCDPVEGAQFGCGPVAKHHSKSSGRGFGRIDFDGCCVGIHCTMMSGKCGYSWS